MKNLKNYKTLKKWCEKLGREGVSKEIIRICEQVAEEQHYKNSVIACGRLHAIGIGCGFDSYWGEKEGMGFSDQVDIAERELENV